MFFRLDDALLELAQDATERVQDAVGLTCFVLARAGHLAAFGTIALLSQYLSPGGHPIAGVVLSYACMYCFIMWRAYAEMEHYYAAGPDTAHGTTLLWRSQSHVRLMNLTLIAAAVGYGLWRESRAIGFGGCLCFWAASLYLQCCIPKRPSRSALRRKLDALRMRLAARPVPTPSPA